MHELRQQVELLSRQVRELAAALERSRRE
jgi:hypothetical protein